MWESTARERTLDEGDAVPSDAQRTLGLLPSPLLLRAREHLHNNPVGPDSAAGPGGLARRIADDPGLLRALGGLRPHEVFGAFDWTLDDDAIEDLAAGIGERVLATMRWLGLGCLESALASARRASMDVSLAGRIGQIAARTSGASRLLLAAGFDRARLSALGRPGPLDAETAAAVRALYGTHRPELAELRLRAFASASWNCAAQPVLRETVLALHGLTPAPADSLVRRAVGGRPWGRARATTIGELGPRTRIRILLEVVRRTDGVGLGAASGLTLLAGLSG